MGEEPLSIAISFLETPGSQNHKLNIIATDREANTLEKAKQGIYDNIQFSEMDNEFKEKYFEKLPENKFKAKKEVLNLIHYHLGDILSKNTPDRLDVIFCRNTVIYFTMEAKSLLYEKFHDRLNQGGFFIMGKTETMQGEARNFFQMYDAHERIFIKE